MERIHFGESSLVHCKFFESGESLLVTMKESKTKKCLYVVSAQQKLK